MLQQNTFLAFRSLDEWKVESDFKFIYKSDISEYIKQNKGYLYYYFDIINKENITKKDINALINTNYNKLIKGE